MNTAPNRRASDNASSPPGTSPTRRFSDMLKESSGSGSILVIDDTNEKIDLTIGDPTAPGTVVKVRGIMVDTEIDIGTVVVEAYHNDGSPFPVYKVSPMWTCASMSGVDPSQVKSDHYTFTGSRIVWTFGKKLDLAIIPPSLAKDLIPGQDTTEYIA